jgi:hypothetical protein
MTKPSYETNKFFERETNEKIIYKEIFYAGTAVLY